MIFSFVLDIDECAMGVSECDHICRNSIGRYSCECYAGYRLNRDRKTCLKGKIKYKVPYPAV